RSIARSEQNRFRTQASIRASLLNSRISARTVPAMTECGAPVFYRQTGKYRKMQIYAAISA
ncbi:MAG: hypothetical protein WCO86_12435, partial [Planctomycetota bacterium]